jgi:tRNA 2-selenouridine synthase
MYGEIDRDLLADAFKKIAPKLGGQHAKEAIESLDNSNLKKAAEIALVYYDKTYKHGLMKRPNSIRVEVDLRDKTPQESALYLSGFLTDYLKK